VTRLRVGGRARLPNGDRLTWTAAEGTRGIRWRESVERDGALVRTLLLETTPAGRPARLEMATGHGLLTLHPESDESAIHGNVVGPAGVVHLAFRWGPAHDLLVVDSPASMAAVVGRLAAAVPVGESGRIEVLRVDDALRPEPGTLVVERTAADGWRLRGPRRDDARSLTVDDLGRPKLRDAETWPLER
jgi:hypothetical protein